MEIRVVVEEGGGKRSIKDEKIGETIVFGSINPVRSVAGRFRVSVAYALRSHIF